MKEVRGKSVFVYELIGMTFIILLGSILHFTFEWSGNNPVVGLFSAVNESVWEHLKLAFWPALLYAIMELRYLKKSTKNFWFAKTVGIYLMPVVITLIFYSYTAITHASIFAIDITSFIVAVVIGQVASYKLLIYKKLADNLGKIALIALAILGVAFMLFTYYPPQLSIFRDPITGEYGITSHAH